MTIYFLNTESRCPYSTEDNVIYAEGFLLNVVPPTLPEPHLDLLPSTHNRVPEDQRSPIIEPCRPLQEYKYCAWLMCITST